jgi:hypothetical protein
MLNMLKNNAELFPYFTTEFLENGVGIIVDPNMPENSFIAIDIDKYYHNNGTDPTPAIADLLLTAQCISQRNNYHIYIIEMKNIKSPRGFSVKNIYEKFTTAIDDFMKKQYADIFLDENFDIVKFKLLFVTDAFRLKKRGWTDKQIRSFLVGTKIETLQTLPPFVYRNFKTYIDYELPNPLITWG